MARADHSAVRLRKRVQVDAAMRADAARLQARAAVGNLQPLEKWSAIRRLATGGADQAWHSREVRHLAPTLAPLLNQSPELARAVRVGYDAAVRLRRQADGPGDSEIVNEA